MNWKLAGVPLAALVLASTTALTWQWARQTTERQALDSLDRQWAAMKGYLRIEAERASNRSSAQWYYHDRDPDESAIVGELRDRSLIVNSDGLVLHTSRPFGPEAARLIKTRLAAADRAYWTETRNAGRYWIRAGVQFDDARRSAHYVALAGPVGGEAGALRRFAGALGGAIASALLLGWLIGRVTAAR
jgi:hypothetical protein